jgi:hypothetical protein
MSFKVAVVCEDHTLDQFIVRPVIGALLQAIGKPRANVHVVTNPQLRGIGDLRVQACELLRRYAPISNAVVYVIDTDCEDGTRGRRDRQADLRHILGGCDADQDKAFTVAAIQEVEVWALWGMRAQLPPWAQVRAHCDPKEAYFEQFVTEADRRRPDRGRTRLVEKTLSAGWASLSSGCQELDELAHAVRAVI